MIAAWIGENYSAKRPSGNDEFLFCHNCPHSTLRPRRGKCPCTGTVTTKFWNIGSCFQELLTDLNTDAATFNGAMPQLIKLNATTALFVQNDPANGSELWTTDGTPAGTHIVKDITPGSVGSGIGSINVTTGGVAYFVVRDGSTQSQLWKSDGTLAGTVIVKDFSTGGFGTVQQ